MTIDYRRWFFAALIGLAAPLLIDPRLILPDHVCSAAEQIQADQWQTDQRNSKIDTAVVPGPDCVTQQQQSYLVNRLPEAARSMAWFSFLVSVISMVLFGALLWPLGRGARRLVRKEWLEGVHEL